MRKLFIILVLLTPLFTVAQDKPYAIYSFDKDGPKAPNTNYLGEAWLKSVIHNDAELGYNITKATFKANSTLNWHKHGSVQVLIILDGAAYYQEKGKEAVVLKKGDIIKCAKDTEHWHSSTKESDVTYLALYSGAYPTVWTSVLTQADYDLVAEKLSEKK
jgi:quercetin dioxygenase-like cupin family protein